MNTQNSIPETPKKTRKRKERKPKWVRDPWEHGLNLVTMQHIKVNFF